MAKKLHQNTIIVKDALQKAGFFVQATDSVCLEVCKNPLSENIFSDNSYSVLKDKKHDYNLFFINVWVFAKKKIEIHLPQDIDFREICTIDNILEYICANYDNLETQWIDRRKKEREKLYKRIAEIKKYRTNGA